MSKDFPFKLERYKNGDLCWVNAVLFTANQSDRQIVITAGDWDSCAGDLDQWITIKYCDATLLTAQLENLSATAAVGNAEKLSSEAAAYRDQIAEPEIRTAFERLYRYFIGGRKNFTDFRAFLDANRFPYQYSAYRSSSDW